MGTKLFLDDIRQPPDNTWAVVKNYAEFVSWIETYGCPTILSMDHDLAFEHYPIENPDDMMAARVPYEKYTEKTGYDCAKWLIDHDLLPDTVIVHSYNPVGAENIMMLFRGRTNLIRKPAASARHA